MPTATMKRRIERLEGHIGGGEPGWGDMVEWVAKFRLGEADESDPAYLDFRRRWAASPRCRAIDEMCRRTQEEAAARGVIQGNYTISH